MDLQLELGCNPAFVHLRDLYQLQAWNVAVLWDLSGDLGEIVRGTDLYKPILLKRAP